ncbi:MAG: hypothetical protein ACQETE_09705 [Bacteroidota bacterium]
MDKTRDYTQDIAEIRSMMERSSKFASLSGWSGVLAGLYALIGAYVAYEVLQFNPQIVFVPISGSRLNTLLWLALTILVLAVSTAVILSYRKAQHRGERIWNATSGRMLTHLAVSLLSGGALLIVLLTHQMIGLLAPFSLIFYGLALHSASTYTLADVKYLGLMFVLLGLIGFYLVSYGLLLWAIGFGLIHMIYGSYIYFRYER